MTVEKATDNEAVVYDEMKATYNDVKDEVTDFVKNNPLASIAIAAGLGFILAKIISGRKK